LTFAASYVLYLFVTDLPTPSLSARFARIIDGLCRVAAARIARTHV